MSEVKCYIKVECSKELPKDGAFYSTDEGRGRYSYYGWSDCNHNPLTPDWWLKEISLTELMVEFAIFYQENKFRLFSAENATEEKLLNEFLISKNICNQI